MTRAVPLACRCGTLRGVAADVGPATGLRVVCYCDDCQAYARWLAVPGLVDAHGGPEIFALAPAQVTLDDTKGALRCMQLREGGLYRFYAGCCRTPVGNALRARVPFIGLSVPFMALPDDATRDAVLGPRSFIQGRFVRGGVPAHASARTPLGLLAKSARLMLGWWLRGQGAPSPIFDDATRAPRHPPEVLAPEVRAPLYGG